MCKITVVLQVRFAQVYLLWVPPLLRLLSLQFPYPTHICLVRQSLCLILNFGIELFFRRFLVYTPCLSFRLHSLFARLFVFLRLISRAIDGLLDDLEAAEMSITLLQFLNLHTSFHVFAFLQCMQRLTLLHRIVRDTGQPGA